MKIQPKLLSSYLLIVALLITIGVYMNYSTIKMGEIQANANKMVEIGTYANTYQKGFDLRVRALIEIESDAEASNQHGEQGRMLTEACGAYLVENLPENSELYTKFEACYNIDKDTIMPILIEMLSSPSSNTKTEATANLIQAHAEVDTHLDNFQLLVVETIQAATAESQSYADTSRLISAVGFATIAVLAIVLALVLSKRITNPLKKLTDVAGKVSMGELNHEIKIESKDEIGELGEAFQRMINAFKMTSAMSQESAEDKS
jgi:HAMP domain-containing protein